MLSRLVAFLAALFFLTAAPALAWFPHGIAAGGGSSPVVLPGSAQPAYDTSSPAGAIFLTNVTVNDLSPTYHGNPGDNGYNTRVSARWNDLPFVMVKGTRRIGLIAFHTPTDAEKAAGFDDNVQSVQVSCDGNATWTTIPGPTVNPDGGGVTDWNFTVNSASWPDGLHTCKARIIPATGPDGLMDGPPFDYSAGYETFNQTNIIIDNGAGTGVAGNVLTVDPNSANRNWHGASAGGNVILGMSVSARGVAAGTFIDGDHTTGNTDCGGGAGSCTGTGSTGTYHVSGPAQTVYGGTITAKIDNGAGAAGKLLTVTSVADGGLTLTLVYGTTIHGAGIAAGTYENGANNQWGDNCYPYTGGVWCTGAGTTGNYAVTVSQNIASQTMRLSTPATFNTQRAFYFLTNDGNSIPRPTYYVCQVGTCAGGVGSDSNNGLTYTAAFASIGKAEYAMWQNDPSSNHRGKFGGTICVLNSGGVPTEYTNYVINPDTKLGYLDIQSASQAPCVAPGDPGGVTINQTTGGAISTRGYFPIKTRWRYINQNGSPDNLSAGDSQYYVADHVTQVHDGLGNGGLLGGGAWMCLEDTTFFGSDGMCSGAGYVRGSTAKYSFQDGLHDVNYAVNNTIDGDGALQLWATAVYHSGTPATLTNVTLLPSELSGYTLSSIFLTGGAYTGASKIDETQCYNGSVPDQRRERRGQDDHPGRLARCLGSLRGRFDRLYVYPRSSPGLAPAIRPKCLQRHHDLEQHL
jgi:hypothetical protein